jgi:hypothetical protein
MNRDDIVRMWEKANNWSIESWPNTIDELERFAKLVAAAEREKVANWMMQRGYATGHGDTTEDLLQELEWQVRESEREACAKVVEQAGIDGYGTLAAALLVRERGAP